MEPKSPSSWAFSSSGCPSAPGTAGASRTRRATAAAWRGRGTAPAEALRRYHLDEGEVIAMGPGRAVRRLAWSEVVTLTEARHALAVEGGGARVRLPLAAPVRSALLARVAAGLAADLWALLDEG